MSTDKFKELDYYGLAYFWNKIKNKFALKTETNITGSNGITVTMPTETSGTSVVVSYDNNDNVVNHIANNDVHVTSSDKTNWNDKYTKTEVDNKISGLVNSAPETLDTLNELATALGNDPNFATTVANQIGTKANSSDVYTKTEIVTSLNSKANASDLTTHTSNSDIHVTSTDKSTWNAKQSALSTAQLNACNSGITSTKVSSYDTHVANSDVHVTTSDKSTWNAKQNALTDTQLSACNSGITSDKVAQYDGYATSKANDSSVVHTSGNETIEGSKTFSNAIRSSSSNRNKFEIINTNIDITSENEDTSDSIYFYDKNRQYINSINSRIKNNSKYLSIRTRTDDNSDYIGVAVSSTENSFRPEKNGSMNLGTSSNKWKTINGINPGALSLPSMSFVNIDTTSFSTTETTIGSFTSTIDGWAILSMSQKNIPFAIWILMGSYRVSFNSVYHNSDYMLFALIPVRNNLTMNIYCTNSAIDSTRKIDWLRIFPCQGNV